jgi:hypothetical protein
MLTTWKIMGGIQEGTVQFGSPMEAIKDIGQALNIGGTVTSVLTFAVHFRAVEIPRASTRSKTI